MCKKPCILAHIMSGGSTALSSGRFICCHNRVPKQLVVKINVVQNKAASILSPCHKMVSFIKEGDKLSLRTKMSQHWLILNGVKDWKIAADIKGGKQYPKVISEYQQHPNIVVQSESLLVIIIIELTMPYELQIHNGKVQGSLWSCMHTQV